MRRFHSEEIVEYFTSNNIEYKYDMKDKNIEVGTMVYDKRQETLLIPENEEDVAEALSIGPKMYDVFKRIN